MNWDAIGAISETIGVLGVFGESEVPGLLD